MKCPKCGQTMRVTHSYKAGASGSTQRLECSQAKCGTVGVTQTVLVAINPKHGEGAYSAARKLAGN